MSSCVAATINARHLALTIERILFWEVGLWQYFSGYSCLALVDEKQLLYSLNF
jgi:hypothetical protein